MKCKKAVILAAGRGIRMHPLTEELPKAMVSLRRKPLLQWHLEALSEVGIYDAAIVVGYKKEKIQKFFGNTFREVSLTCIEQKQQLGSAHAIGLARKFVGREPFIVLYCDVVMDASTISKLAEIDELSPYEVLMLGREVQDPWRYGVLVVEGSQVSEIVEKPPYGEEPSRIINAGAYQFRQSIFDAIEKTPLSERGEYEITDSIRMLAKDGKVGFIGMCKGICIDIGDLDDLKEAERIASGA